MKAEFASYIRTVQFIPKSTGNNLGVGEIFFVDYYNSNILLTFTSQV